MHPMDFLTDLGQVLARPLTGMIDPGNPGSIYMLGAALLFTLGFVVIARRRRGTQDTRLRAFFRFIFNPRVWLHRSSMLDYKLYAVNTILLASVLTVFLVGSDFWVERVGPWMAAAFGPPPVNVSPSWWICGITTLAQILALDFGYWLAHFGFHRSEILWEFHKVHHSAEVMTPATELRQHPVELIAFPIVFGFTTGITYAVMVQIFGAEAQQLGLTGQNIILIIHLMTFHHLRHSHVAMPFTGFWGKLLHSPAHHEIHHSADPKHFDRNMGYLFSIWDWLADTLVMPRKGETITLGIGHEGASHDSVGNVMWLPFRNAARLIAARWRRPAPAEAPAREN